MSTLPDRRSSPRWPAEPRRHWNWPLIAAIAYTAAVWIAAIAAFNWYMGAPA